MNIGEMFGSMGLVGLSVMVCLVGLSIYSGTVILDKARRFRAAANQSSQFVPVLGRCLREGKLQDAVNQARHHEKSHVARVIGEGITEASNGCGAHPDLVARVLERSTARTMADMKKGLGALATIGSTAPFIGLFGTIVGIVHAFQGIAESGSGGVAAVSGGIAEALVATALGILVAIPAVMAFNHFVGRLERFHVEMDTSAAELVDFFHRRARGAHATAR